MKRFLITLLLSSIIITCVWIVPELTNASVSQSIERIENPIEHRQGFYDPDNIRLDTIPITALEEIPVLAARQKKETDWQALITWIIGSLNGIFGLIILAKKVFSKS